MLPHAEYTRARLKQLGERMRQRIYADVRPVRDLRVSGATDRIGYAEAQRLAYRRAKLGDQFGPLWATFWFRGRVEVPREWRGSRVDLLWISHSEATLWLNGRPQQGLNHDPSGWDRSTRPDALLIESARGGDDISFAVEMACNRPFGAPLTPMVRNLSPFVLDRCDIARFDREAWDIYYDFFLLQELEAELAKENASGERTWCGELLAQLNEFANLYDSDDRRTWAAARRILRRLYRRHNADQTHELSAIGHAHIDTAWLWPLAETHRKCIRTFSSQTAYMRDYPEFRFAASQAYQYSQIQAQQPQLFQRIRAAVRRGQWVPVGGTWVEPDCNLPSGESLVRQFVHGQRYFELTFGHRCAEFWNPDVFGYNGQLPQILRGAGIERFLTQKLSWNRFNKPAHHTFVWQGIDGSEVLAHFPPADTYNAMASVADLRRSMRDYKDHDRSRHSLMLFGFGDGGGGPTRHMLEILRRARDLQGLPRTRQRSSDRFFSLLEGDCSDRPTVIGELYFEYHRGTYTSQARTKQGNRRCEQLLHDVEFLWSWAHAVGITSRRASYPAAELDQLWKQLLLHQFHDILPGSSIGEVYADTARDHAQIEQSALRLRDAALARLQTAAKGEQRDVTVINSAPFARAEVVQLPDRSLGYAAVPAYASSALSECPDRIQARRLPRGGVELQNAHLTARLAANGQLLRLIDRASGRNALAAPGNVMELYEDRPTAFDAWDIDPFHLETGVSCPPATRCTLRDASPLRAEVVFERRIGRRSSMQQTVRLDAQARRLEFHTEVDWHESHRLLKVAFPVEVRAMNATYEMQFGCVERPTHYNTSHDLARYEVPAHRWADLSEHGFGVALLSDSKYGFSTFGNTMRLSLLRAPKYPDPNADIGKHHFAYAIMPHAGSWQEAGVVAEAACFNMPMLVMPGSLAPSRLLQLDDSNLVLDTIKKAESGDGLILRFYEAHGARGVARLQIGFPVRRATYCNLLEDDATAIAVRNGTLRIPYRPFQIISVKLTRSAA